MGKYMLISDETNYDRVAEKYIAAADSKPFTANYERPFILANLPDLSGKTVLDLGCATGFYSKYCLDHGADVISVDASRKMVAHTAKICENKNRTYVHDIAKIFSFVESNTIDLIICSLVLHYIDNWNNTLEEFHRMLTAGGKCLISTHHPICDYTYFNQDDYFLKRLVEDEWDGFNTSIKVKYFVRPLNEYIQPMIDCKLQLNSISEPKPDTELATIDQKVFERLQRKPTFLFFVLEKDV
jgi:SAM-dependent methyltransferase